MQPTQSVSTNASFGSLLDGFFDNVNNTIQQATQDMKNAGIELEIEAGEEIGRAIEQVKNAYQKELEYTIDRVSKEAKIAFDRLGTMVQQFEIATEDKLGELMSQAQQLANTLPFANKQPQLMRIKPRYIVIDDVAKTSFVTFKGNFVYSSTPGFEPSLSFSGRSCYLYDSDTQTLVFQVPHSAFGDADPTQYSYKTGILTLPWDDGSWWSHKTSSVFRVGLGALPTIAGTATVTYVSDKTDRLTKTVKNNYPFNGNDFYPEEWHTCYQKIYPTTDWKIDVSKAPRMTTEHYHGKHTQEIVSYTPGEIVLKVSLYCKDGHNIGIVNIGVEFDEYQDKKTQVLREEKIQMNWKNSKLLKPGLGETISFLTFDDYKGVHSEYGAPDLSGNVLKIAAEGNGMWKIWTEMPKNMGLEEADFSKKVNEEIALTRRLQRLLNTTNLPREMRPLPRPVPVITQTAEEPKEEKVATNT